MYTENFAGEFDNETMGFMPWNWENTIKDYVQRVSGETVKDEEIKTLIANYTAYKTAFIKGRLLAKKLVLASGKSLAVCMALVSGIEKFPKNKTGITGLATNVNKKFKMLYVAGFALVAVVGLVAVAKISAERRKVKQISHV